MVLHEMADALRRLPPAVVHRRATATVDPGAAYAGPSDVMCDVSLSREEKIALLTHWRDDLAMSSQARGEGMVGSDEGLGRRLAMINRALARLSHA
jgi:hypothetical protein